MRFFTDDFFTRQQKVEMLGGAYAAYVKELQKEKQLEMERQLRVKEMESNRFQQQKRVTRNYVVAGFAALAFIILLVVLSSGLGVLPGNV